MSQHVNRSLVTHLKARPSSFASELPMTCFLRMSFCACSFSSAPIAETAIGSSIHFYPQSPVSRSKHKNSYINK